MGPRETRTAPKENLESRPTRLFPDAHRLHRSQIAVLTDALHARTGADLGAASFRATFADAPPATTRTEDPPSTGQTPSEEERRRDGASPTSRRESVATGAGVRVGTNPGVTVHWCRRAT